MIASLKRIGALIVKELHQVVRDPGNVGIAVILPAVLLLLFGYGMSMQSGLFKIRICSFPKPYGTCLKIIVTKLIGIEIGHSSIKAAISFFLQFGQCQYIKIMLAPFLFVSQHQIAKQ